MSFEVDMRKFVAKAKDNADEIVRITVRDIVTSIDEMSPVGNPDIWKNPDNKPEGYVGGHFRGNWQLGVGSLPTGTIDGIDPTGKATVAKAVAQIPYKAAGQIYYYANNLPYAIPLEEGHSHQAPNGMVGLTAVRFQSMIQKNLARLK